VGSGGTAGEGGRVGRVTAMCRLTVCLGSNL
jgi:hypothetical protein